MTSIYWLPLVDYVVMSCWRMEKVNYSHIYAYFLYHSAEARHKMEVSFSLTRSLYWNQKESFLWHFIANILSGKLIVDLLYCTFLAYFYSSIVQEWCAMSGVEYEYFLISVHYRLKKQSTKSSSKLVMEYSMGMIWWEKLRRQGTWSVS